MKNSLIVQISNFLTWFFFISSKIVQTVEILAIFDIVSWFFGLTLWFKVIKSKKKSKSFKNFGVQMFSESIDRIFSFDFQELVPVKIYLPSVKRSPLDRARLDTEEDEMDDFAGARHGRGCNR